MGGGHTPDPGQLAGAAGAEALECVGGSKEGPVKFVGLLEAGKFPLKLNCWFQGRGAQVVQSAQGAPGPGALCPCPGAAFLPSPDSPLARPEHPLHWWLCPQRSACVDAEGWAGGAQPHPGPTGDPGASPTAELCAGSQPEQPGVEVLGSFPREFLVPADGRPSCGRGPGGTWLEGLLPRPHTASWAPSSQAKCVPALRKDLAAPGKGWEDPELQAGVWKLIAALSQAGRSKPCSCVQKGCSSGWGFKLTTWPRCVWGALSASSSPILGPGPTATRNQDQVLLELGGGRNP